MKVSTKGLKLITDFEGFRGTAYQDVVGVWTIGYGSTENVYEGETITKGAAEVRLKIEMAKYEAGVMEACTLPPNQNQFDALCSFAYNVGVGGMRKSSVIKAHNRGDFDAAARAFGLWNKAGGKVYTGLTRRRAAEAVLYLTPVEAPEPAAVAGMVYPPPAPEPPRTAPQPNPGVMPQRVDAERPLTASRINQGAFAAGATAAVATTAQIIKTIDSVKTQIAGLGDIAIPMLLIAVIGLCSWIVYERVAQRRNGVA